MVKAYLIAAIMAAVPIAALPSDNVLARAECNQDNCYRAVLHSGFLGCSSFVSVTVTPCTSTVTSTATVTTTSTVNTFPEKRDAIPTPVAAALEVRQESSCVFTTNSPTSMPAYAVASCTSLGTTAPAARLSSACSCNGVTATTTTLATPTTTVTSTSTATATVYPTPSAFILQSTGDPSLYVTVDDTGALRLITDTSSAVPFYVDSSGQLRNLNNPDLLLVDYYEPSPGTADNTVYNAVPSTSNYGITCQNSGASAGGFIYDCQSSGPPDGNPVVYGFGTCPNEGYYVYMIPNDSNVRCYDGGYAFGGFYFQPYTG